MAITLRLNKNEALTYEELDGNFSELNSRTTALENARSNWDTAYGWGDHSQIGYLTFYQETDPVFEASAASEISTQNINNWSTAYNWGNHANAGYLTTLPDISLGSLQDVDLSDNPETNQLLKWNGTAWAASTFAYTETDPIFNQSPAAGIGNTEISNWNTAYSWGDHASAGYLDGNDPAASITTQNITNWNDAYGWGNHSAAGYLSSLGSIANHSDVSISGVSDGFTLVWQTDQFVPQAVSGNTNVSISDNSPATPAAGDLWWDSASGVLKIYYTDADGSQWVDAVPQAGNSIALPNEDYVMYGTAGAAESQNAIAEGSPLQTEASTDLEVSVTVSGGRTRTFIHFSGYFYNTSDPANYSGITLQRELNGSGTWSSICKHFAVSTNGSGGDPGCTYFSFVDTHGATDGDVVAYRWINSTFADNWGSVNTEAVGQVFNRTGDVFSVKEI